MAAVAGCDATAGVVPRALLPGAAAAHARAQARPQSAARAGRLRPGAPQGARQAQPGRQGRPLRQLLTAAAAAAAPSLPPRLRCSRLRAPRPAAAGAFARALRRAVLPCYTALVARLLPRVIAAKARRDRATPKLLRPGPILS
eukprot:scaffold561_cov306-Prasinococcus_capsulatus_cf.AAC.2